MPCVGSGAGVVQCPPAVRAIAVRADLMRELLTVPVFLIDGVRFRPTPQAEMLTVLFFSSLFPAPLFPSRSCGQDVLRNSRPGFIWSRVDQVVEGPVRRAANEARV